MKPQFIKIASSGTKEGIIKLINEFYFSNTFTVNFDNGEVTNSKGVVKHAKVILSKGKYIYGMTS